MRISLNKLGIKNGINNSRKLWKKAISLIPCGTQTFSKMPSQFVEGVYPVYLVRGQGCIVEDVDGNRFIDYPLSLGPIILGYNYKRISQAIKDQLNKGIVFSLPNPLEIELAEEIRKSMPSAGMVRFTKTGSEATSAAVRIARAFTGRNKVAYWGYHGWHEWYMAANEQYANGIPSDYKKFIFNFQYNNIDSLHKILKQHGNEMACVIMEPIGLEFPKDNFLEKVRELTHRFKTLLVFDETITGFRIAVGGAQGYFKVIPDISVIGKAIGNGMPIAAVVGKKEIMRVCNKIFFSSTFAGELLSIRAALETIREIRQRNVCEYINRLGNNLKDGFNEIAKKEGIKAELKGYGARHSLVFSQYNDEERNTLLKSLFWQETVKRGVLFGAAQYISFSHARGIIDYTLGACQDSLKIVKKAIEENRINKYLEGRPVRPILKKRYKN